MLSDKDLGKVVLSVVVAIVMGFVAFFFGAGAAGITIAVSVGMGAFILGCVKERNGQGVLDDGLAGMIISVVLSAVIGGLVSIFVQYGETLGPVSSILVMGAFIVCEVQRGSDTDASDS